MTPTARKKEHEITMQQKLFEARTGKKQVLKKEAIKIKNATKKKPAKPLKDTIKELSSFINSYLESRIPVNNR